MDCPGGSAGKGSAHKAGGLGLIPGSGRSPGGGHGSPLRYSCLNPMDRAAWQAAVHGVAESQTRLTKHSAAGSEKKSEDLQTQRAGRDERGNVDVWGVFTLARAADLAGASKFAVLKGAPHPNFTTVCGSDAHAAVIVRLRKAR